jgi:hypothetical protein
MKTTARDVSSATKNAKGWLATKSTLRLAHCNCLEEQAAEAVASVPSSFTSSSTTSPTPRVRVPRHVARLVSPLAVDYFAYAKRPGASARRAARYTARCRLLCAPRLRLAATLALVQSRRVSRLLVSRQHWLYINYAAHRRDVVFRSHRVDHSSRLVFQTS